MIRPRSVLTGGGTGVLAALLATGALPGGAGSARAAPPAVFAIRDARVVPVSGPVLEKGTVVVRDGLIEAVGSDVAVPGDARVIAGEGLVVYPGLIDAGSDIGLPATAVPPAATGGRGGGAPPAAAAAASPTEPPSNLNSYVRAADLLTDGGTRAEAARSAGITTVLATPNRGVFAGQSALINLNGDRATMVVRSPVALHLRLTPERGAARTYPGALLGVIAYIRQTLLDTRRYEESWAIYRKNVRALRRPETDRALEALVPVLHGQLPVVVPAATPAEIERAIRLGDEFQLSLMISGGGEAAKVADLLREKRVPVLLSLKFPEPPRDAHPDTEESLRSLQRRAEAPRAAAGLAKAGVRFAFYSDGLAAPRDFIKNAARTVTAGLPAEAALRAMTLTPAELFGVQEQLGSIEKGKIANLVVTDGDLFGEKTKVRFVFVDGNRFEIPDTPAPAPRPRRGTETP